MKMKIILRPFNIFIFFYIMYCINLNNFKQSEIFICINNQNKQ